MADRITAFLVRLAPLLMEWAIILFPLALYLIWLGFDVARRKKPLLLSGTVDALLLAAALSGFILLGPPTWVLDRYAQVSITSYVLAYIVYLVLVLILAHYWVRSRRKSLVVYCIDPEVFPQHMRAALDSLNTDYQITPGRLAVDGNKLIVDLEASLNLFTVTLYWSGEAALWDILSTRLRSELKGLQTRNNPAGALLPLWAGLVLMFCSLSTVIFVWYLAYMAV